MTRQRPQQQRKHVGFFIDNSEHLFSTSNDKIGFDFTTPITYLTSNLWAFWSSKYVHYLLFSIETFITAYLYVYLCILDISWAKAKKKQKLFDLWARVWAQQYTHVFGVWSVQRSC